MSPTIPVVQIGSKKQLKPAIRLWSTKRRRYTSGRVMNWARTYWSSSFPSYASFSVTERRPPRRWPEHIWFLLLMDVTLTPVREALTTAATLALDKQSSLTAPVRLSLVHAAAAEGVRGLGLHHPRAETRVAPGRPTVRLRPTVRPLSLGLYRAAVPDISPSAASGAVSTAGVSAAGVSGSPCLAHEVQAAHASGVLCAARGEGEGEGVAAGEGESLGNHGRSGICVGDGRAWHPAQDGASRIVVQVAFGVVLTWTGSSSVCWSITYSALSPRYPLKHTSTTTLFP
ncbi:hypothetical protein FIBSPDRAFT_905143 [Athelia psychrophila]|uniref:Uncharacterized protein n=1 Tax=Athelia psychrophila TaxID=1759441 RepID=A0A167TTK5_9AGAM|nr:hypothetical protein FIBSPDRAFT_905143 [Fibularhizoctonia sp. CBS 109695]